MSPKKALSPGNADEEIATLIETLHRTGQRLEQLTGGEVDTVASLGQLQRSHAAGYSQVTLDLDLGPLFLGIDQAVPCGLILNELVSNALKHAFPGGRPGSVSIELTATEGGRFCLRVGDNGIGLPADFAARQGRSLGLQIVSTLVKQLNGSVAVGPAPAAAFAVTFMPTEKAETPGIRTSDLSTMPGRIAGSSK